MTDDEIQQATDLLKKLEPGFLPYPVFEQVARLVALPILELVPYRMANGQLEILLLERPANDRFWPNALHTPGTVIRASDLNAQTHGLEAAFTRLVRDELGDVRLGAPQFVASLLHESKRGTEQAQVYCAELLEEPKVGKLFAVSELPENLIAQQHDFIQRVAGRLRPA